MVETKYSVPGAPRIALLTDLHSHFHDDVIRSLKRNAPALICVAGDLINYSKPLKEGLFLEEKPESLAFLEKCAAVAPTYLSLGNHEKLLHEDDLMLIRRTGVTLLDNNWIEADGMVIGGLTSGQVTYYRGLRKTMPTSERYPCIPSLKNGRSVKSSSAFPPDLSWIKGYAAATGYHILLSHHPEYFPLLPAAIELVLSGHAHGGQWNYYSFTQKRWCGVFAPGQGFRPVYTSGIYQGRLVVSRGLANTVALPRFFNPTEIVFIN